MAKNFKISRDEIKVGFDTQTIILRIDQLIPTKVVSPATKASAKYRQIVASIRAVGIIEPLAVAPQSNGKYILLDGHMRLEALKELSEIQVVCLISKDDEAFTYNKHVNRLSTVQEHKMIMRAVERGVPESKIAAALNVDVASIVRKRTLLEGICAEAAELIKNEMVAAAAFPILRRMKALRQVEAVTLMKDAKTFSGSYARALLAATPRDQLTDPDKPKNVKGLDEEQMARMETEMASLQREFRIIEENYGTDVLNLTLAKGYLGTLLGNARIVRYLAQNHPEILSQFQKITEITTLSKAEAA